MKFGRIRAPLKLFWWNQKVYSEPEFEETNWILISSNLARPNSKSNFSIFKDIFLWIPEDFKEMFEAIAKYISVMSF